MNTSDNGHNLQAEIQKKYTNNTTRFKLGKERPKLHLLHLNHVATRLDNMDARGISPTEHLCGRIEDSNAKYSLTDHKFRERKHILREGFQLWTLAQA